MALLNHISVHRPHLPSSFVCAQKQVRARRVVSRFIRRKVKARNYQALMPDPNDALRTAAFWLAFDRLLGSLNPDAAIKIADACQTLGVYPPADLQQRLDHIRLECRLGYVPLFNQE